jgi:hypothetical protein
MQSPVARIRRKVFTYRFKVNGNLIVLAKLCCFFQVCSARNIPVFTELILNVLISRISWTRILIIKFGGTIIFGIIY